MSKQKPGNHNRDNFGGVFTCSRYSYPPNSLSLCGPAKQSDLKWYATTGETDTGTKEILSQFSTLYPYLSLISYENNIKNPLSLRVVEAYWLGNTLLANVTPGPYARFLTDTLELKKKNAKKSVNMLLHKLDYDALPHHSFHVLNVYKRTGHLDVLHTIETMDACLVNWGKIIALSAGEVIVETKKLTRINDTLTFGKTIIRKLFPQGRNDIITSSLKIGDIVSYHWGYVCQKLSVQQFNNLNYYTSLSLKMANLH